MLQAITGFDQDEERHWRAMLACGHRQHVRHDPPLMSRPWVLDEPGRAARIGQALDCVKCDRTVVLLESDRLLLREFRFGVEPVSDAEHLVELDADPEVVRYVHLASPTTAEKARDWIAHVTMTFYETRPGFGFWAILEREGSRFVGWVHLKPGNDESSGELGYRLRRDAWGRGYATEISRAVLGHAFDQLQLQRVTASALMPNRASIRVMEKLRMSPVRHFVEPRTGGDAVEYAIDRTALLSYPPSVR